MREEDYRWLQLNQHVFQNVKLTREELERLIHMYNRVTGQNQKMTGCARCISNIKKRLKVEYDRYESV